jgi:hypothetical protein
MLMALSINIIEPLSRTMFSNVQSGLQNVFFYLGFSSLLRFFLNHSGFLDHIQLIHTVGLFWTSDQPVAEASTYTGQHNRQTFMYSAGFEPETPATKRPHNYALDRAANEVGKSKGAPLQEMEALGGRGDIAPTYSPPRH